VAVMVSLLISVRFWLYSTFIWRWNVIKVLIWWGLWWIYPLIPSGARISRSHSLLWKCLMVIVFHGIRTSCKSVLTKRNYNFQLIFINIFRFIKYKFKNFIINNLSYLLQRKDKGEYRKMRLQKYEHNAFSCVCLQRFSKKDDPFIFFILILNIFFILYIFTLLV